MGRGAGMANTLLQQLVWVNKNIAGQKSRLQKIMCKGENFPFIHV